MQTVPDACFCRDWNWKFLFVGWRFATSFFVFGVVYNIIMLLSNILYTVIILCVWWCLIGLIGVD